MNARTATLRLQLVDAVSGPSKNASNSLRGVDTAIGRLGKSGSPQIKRLVNQLDSLKKKAGSIDDFTATRRGFKDLAAQMAAARSNVSRLEQALKSAAKPTTQMKSQLDAAKASLKSTTQAFRDQGNAVRSSERALQSYGMAGRRDITGAQKAIRSELAKTIREMRRLDQEGRKPKPQRTPPPRQPPGPRPPGAGSPAYDAVTAAGGGLIANTGKNIAEKSFLSSIDFNQAAEYQAALGDFKGDDRKALNRQAEQIGGDTRFNNVDVVKAQTQILQGGVRDPKTIMDLTKKVTEYALAMGTTLEEAAETVRGSALSKRVNLKDAAAIGNFVDSLVWMAKNGGMNDEDVRQYMKYGGASTTGAGLPDEYAAAMAMMLRQGGVRGDEAGVFARSASSKLVAPTKKGKNALFAMGIDYNKYTKIDSMNPEGVGMLMKDNFSVRLTPDMIEQVKELIDNGEFTDSETGESRSVISDAGEFSTQMADILAPLFSAKGKKMTAQDAKALNNALSTYQKNSLDSVDVVGLMNAIAGSNPTLPNLNAFFTDKQGGRANIIFQKWAQFQEQLKKMQNVPGGIANKIGTEANQGVYGDWTKLTGSVENAMLKIGQDWEFATRPMITKIDDVVSGFTNLSESTRRLIEAFGGAVALLAGYTAVKAGGSLITRLLSGGAATPTTTAATATAAPAAAAGAGVMSRLVGGLGKVVLPLAVGTTLGKGSLVNDPKTVAAIRKKFGAPLEDGAAKGPAAPAFRKAAINEAQAAPIEDQLQQEILNWPLEAQAGMRDYIAAIMTGGAEAQAKAAAVGETIKAELEITARPGVDTGSLERALGIARQLAAAMRGEVSGVSTAPAAPSAGSGGVGTPRRAGGRVKEGVTYPVGGKGPEFFTPGADGFITPNGGGGAPAAGGARVTVQQTNHFHGGKKTDFEDAAKILDRQLSRAAQTAFSGLKYGDG